MVRRARALRWLRHTILSVRGREVIFNRRLGWCCVHCDRTEKISFPHAHNTNLQMTAAWDSGTTAVSAEKFLGL